MSEQATNGDEEGNDVLIEVSDLQKHCILGTGELANVYLVTHQPTQKPYALKVFDKLHMFEHTAGFDAVKSMTREASVLRHPQVRSPFVLQMYKAWQDAKNVYFLLPLIQGGELSKRLYGYSNLHGEEKGLPVKDCQFYSAGIALAIAHLHSHNIAYRDLKPDNVMLDEHGYTILIDLGFTKIMAPDEEKTFTMCGTPGYVAPEQLASGNRGGGVRRGHSKLVDWWSFAVVLYELLRNRTPFQAPGMHDYDTQDAIMIADYQCPEFFPISAKQLVDALLVVDVSQRLGYTPEVGKSNHQAILQHAWFEGIDFDKLQSKELPAPWLPTLKDSLDTSHFYEYDEAEEAYTPYRRLTEQEQKDFPDFDWIEEPIL